MRPLAKGNGILKLAVAERGFAVGEGGEVGHALRRARSVQVEAWSLAWQAVWHRTAYDDVEYLTVPKRQSPPIILFPQLLAQEHRLNIQN